MPGAIGTMGNAASKSLKKGPNGPFLIPRTSAAWARKQRRDKRAKHAELHEDEQPFEAAL